MGEEGLGAGRIFPADKTVFPAADAHDLSLQIPVESTFLLQEKIISAGLISLQLSFPLLLLHCNFH